MKPNIQKSLFASAQAGLLLAALTACAGSNQPAESPDEVAASAEAEPTGEKACCKGMNECRGKGGCRAGEHSCKGQNECKAQGGCNAHCPN